MTDTGRHNPNDDCPRDRKCRACGRGGWRHDHKCGVRVCPSCKSLDIRRRRGEDGTSYDCGMCGSDFDAPLFMSIQDRLGLGA